MSSSKVQQRREDEHTSPVPPTDQASSVAGDDDVKEWLERITDGFFTLDVNWRFTYLNQNGAAIFRREREQLLGRNIWEAFPESVGTRFQAEYERAMATGTTVSFEEYYAPYDGWYELNVYPSCTGLSVYLRDVTQRKRGEALREAIHAINTVLHRSLDRDTVMRRALTEAVGAIGCDTAVISLRIGGRWIVRYVYGIPQTMVGSEMIDDEELHAVQAIRTKQPVAVSDASTDQRVNRKHLEKWGIRAVLVVPLLLHDEAIGVLFLNFMRSPFAFGAIHLEFASQLAAAISRALDNARLFSDLETELAERRRMESALRESEERFRLAVEHFPGVFNIYDHEGRLQFVSAAALHLTGLPASHFLGKREDEIWPEAVHGQHLPTLAKTFETKTVQTVEISPKLPNGVSFTHHLTYVPLLNEKGDIRQVLGIAHDITTQKQAEALLRQSRDEFESLVAQRTVELERQREVLQTIIDNIPVMLAFFDNSVKRFKLNRACERVIGYTTEEVETINLLEALYPDPSYRQIVIDHMLKGQGIWRDLEIITKSGRVLPTTWANVHLSGGSSIGIGIDISERKAAEAALRESEEKFRNLVEQHPDAISITVDDRFVYLNAQGLRLFGVESPEAIVGRSVLDFVAPAHREATIDRLELLARGEPAAPRELVIRREDGATVHVEGRAIQITYRGRGATLGVIRDITERKRMETALRESEQRLRTAIANAPLILWTMSPDGTLTFLEGAGLEKTGIVPEELIGKNMFDLYQGDPVIIDNLNRALAGESLTAEVITRTGALLESRHAPLRDDHGNVTGVLGVTMDITERKRSEAAFREQAQLLDIAHDAIIVRTLDGRIRYWNRGAERTYGYTSSEAIGSLQDELLQSQFPEPLSTMMERLQSEGSWEGRVRQTSKDGHPRVIASRWVARLDGAGRVTEVLAVNRDITARSVAEEQLRAINDTLEHRARQLTALASELTKAEDRERRRVAQVLHDHLQQLLVGAKLYLSMAMAKTREDDARPALLQIEDLLKQSIDTTRSLTVELAPPILRAEGLGEALRWLALWIREQHRLDVEVDGEDRPDDIPEDLRVFVFQAVRELLFNVVKHADVKQAQVRLIYEEDLTRIVVADKGSGFNPSRLAQKERTSGGFGLFSLQERLAAVGGTLEIDTGLGRGTCVTLVLPRTERPLS